MIVEMQGFMSEQSQALADQAQKFRKDPEQYMRKALADSAQSLKSLKSPIRVMAHSGVKFTVVSQNAVQNLIELESEVITSALAAAAKRCERAAQAENLADLVLDQADMFAATRDRVVDEATRAVEIFKVAGRDMRKVGMHVYEQVFQPAEEELPKATTRTRKTKRAVGKAGRTVRKPAARAH
jgi:hypothetical protein